MRIPALLIVLLVIALQGSPAQTAPTHGTMSPSGAPDNSPAPLLPGFGPDLARLQDQQRKDAEAALEPINRRYAEALQQLLRRTTAGGDADTAAKVRRELERLGPAAGLRLRDAVQTFEQRLAGTTWSFPLSGKLSSIEFKPKGELIIGWNPLGQGYTWRMTGERTVEVFPYANRQHGETLQFGEDERSATLVHDGKSIPLTRLKEQTHPAP